MKPLASFALIYLLGAALAQDARPRSDPPGVKVELKLVAKRDTYALDLGGKTAAEFKQLLKESAKTGSYPPPVPLDLAFEIHNTGDKEIQVWIGGDATLFLLDLQGPGAVSIDVVRAMTLEFRPPRTEKIAAGKSLSFPVAALQFGVRGMSRQAFWTEPGEYSLTATYKTGISPAPKGAKVEEGFGRVTLTSTPVKLKVEKK